MFPLSAYDAPGTVDMYHLYQLIFSLDTIL